MLLHKTINCWQEANYKIAHNEQIVMVILWQKAIDFPPLSNYNHYILSSASLSCWQPRILLVTPQFLADYPTRIIITQFETALNYKPQILDPKIEEFPCLLNKFSVTLTTLRYKPQWKMGWNKYKSRIIMAHVR